MSSRTVTTQAELDKALADKIDWIEIESDAGVWLEISNCGSATVRASGSATVTAYDSATVTASTHTAVHLHSASVNINGGVIIDHTKIDLTVPSEWAAYHGVEVAAGVATVYKAVNDSYTTDRCTDYSPGATPHAPDWKSDAYCGNGLHFGPTPHHALAYHPEATRFMEAKIALADLVVLTGGAAKCKAPRVVEPLVEVDIHGERVATAVADDLVEVAS